MSYPQWRSEWQSVSFCQRAQTTWLCSSVWCHGSPPGSQTHLWSGKKKQDLNQTKTLSGPMFLKGNSSEHVKTPWLWRKTLTWENDSEEEANQSRNIHRFLYTVLNLATCFSVWSFIIPSVLCVFYLYYIDDPCLVIITNVFKFLC